MAFQKGSDKELSWLVPDVGEGKNRWEKRRRKAIFLSVIDVKIVLEYQPQEAGILRRESRFDKHKLEIFTIQAVAN